VIPAKRSKKCRQSENDSNALKANCNKALNQIVSTLHEEEGNDDAVPENEKPKPLEPASNDVVDYLGLDTVNMSPESEYKENCDTDSNIEKTRSDQSNGSKFKINSDADTPEEEKPITTSAPVTADQRQLVSTAGRKALGRYAQKARAYGIPLTINEIISSSTEEFIKLTSGLKDQQISLCKDIRRQAKNKIAAQNSRQRKLNPMNNLADEVGRAKDYKEKLVAEKDQLCRLKTEWSNKLQQLEESILRGMNRDPSQWELGISTTSTSRSGDRVSVIAREPTKRN